jgi:hypothetical protein
MSLTSASLGARAGTGALRFEGTWYDFARAARAWASAVSAQSYHFRALSALRPP